MASSARVRLLSARASPGTQQGVGLRPVHVFLARKRPLTGCTRSCCECESFCWPFSFIIHHDTPHLHSPSSSYIMILDVFILLHRHTLRVHFITRYLGSRAAWRHKNTLTTTTTTRPSPSHSGESIYSRPDHWPFTGRFATRKVRRFFHNVHCSLGNAAWPTRTWHDTRAT